MKDEGKVKFFFFNFNKNFNNYSNWVGWIFDLKYLSDCEWGW